MTIGASFVVMTVEKEIISSRIHCENNCTHYIRVDTKLSR